MGVLSLISPIDGRVYAERETLGIDAARAAWRRASQSAKGRLGRDPA